jgi:transcriptional regulator with XRE-family HTH domain
MNFGQALRKLRLEHHLGVNQLALKSGVSASQISRYENNTSTNPTTDTIKKLATALNDNDQLLMQLAGNIPENKKDSKKRHYYDLTEKEELDIAHMAEKMLQGMDTNASVNFYGEPMTDDQKESMRDIIEMGLRINKEKAKKKFTPKKYRDDSGD